MNALLQELQYPFVGHPIWLWLVFISLWLSGLAFDLGLLHHRDQVLRPRRALGFLIGYALLALGFGTYVYWDLGQAKAIEFYTGYLLELSLSLDNVFVIAVILSFFNVKPRYHRRVLFWGLLGIVVLRLLTLSLGSLLVREAYWILYLFSAFLVVTGFRMLIDGMLRPISMDIQAVPGFGLCRKFIPLTSEVKSSAFFIKMDGQEGSKGRWHATPLFLALFLVVVADLVFAIDSVPSIFAITPDPFIVISANLFAILGLRALYHTLSAGVRRLRFLKLALAMVLIFIGAKIFFGDLFFNGQFPPLMAMQITLGLLLAGFAGSLIATSGEGVKKPKGGVAHDPSAD